MKKLLLLLIIPLLFSCNSNKESSVSNKESSVSIELSFGSEGFPHMVVGLINVHNFKLYHVYHECWDINCLDDLIHFKNVKPGIYIAFYCTTDIGDERHLLGYYSYNDCRKNSTVNPYNPKLCPIIVSPGKNLEIGIGQADEFMLDIDSDLLNYIDLLTLHDITSK